MAVKLEKFATYKGRPIVKSGNMICYGNPADGAVLLLIILTTKQYKGCEIPDMIFLQVQNPKTGEIYKQAEKNGLFCALDIGSVWLERELKRLA